ncbi:hypothetical protein [Duganella sp.]|uniref:hypothetical protein n=1 Tax=Duganella sp. TaxID=1904440 RepID=UPI0031E2C3CF
MNSLESTKYRNTLEAGGVPPAQALAHADALGEVLENIPTKDWVRAEIQALKFDMLKWMISLFLAQTSVAIGAVVVLIRYLPH